MAAIEGWKNIGQHGVKWFLDGGFRYALISIEHTHENPPIGFTVIVHLKMRHTRQQQQLE